MHLSLSLCPSRMRSSKTGARTNPSPYVTDERWLVIADVVPHRPTGGRPRVHPQACLESALWVLVIGAPWQDAYNGIPLLRLSGEDCREMA